MIADMQNLTATFIVRVDAPCLVTWPEEPPPRFTSTIDGFSVVAALHFIEGQRSRKAGEVDWTFKIASIEIAVSRSESDFPSTPIVDGQRDLTFQQSYLSPKASEYGAVARKVAERFLNFFKFDLMVPLVHVSALRADDFNNAEWVDAKGQSIAGPITFTIQPIPGASGRLGAKRLTADRIADLASHIEGSPIEASLVKSLMSDAQAAWYEGNLRRAVLELAIAAEISVKRRYFQEHSPAGAAFDSLEDNGRLSVRVLELISKVAADVFGHSYKAEYAAKYTDIDQLFRCRNKIAHRGDLSYRDDGGQLQAVDANTVEKWWGAVVHLTNWLKSLR